MKKIIKNAIIVTLNRNNEIIGNGQVEIDGNRITYVGAERLSEGEIIDANGNVIMPGFVNTHCHLAMTLFRGCGENTSFDNWWRDVMRPKEEHLEKGDCYYGVTLGIFELIKNGVTTVADFYINPTETARAVKDMGIRASIGVGAITGKEVVSEEFLSGEISSISITPLIKPILYAHSLYSCDESQFNELNKYAIKHNILKSTHISETLKEVGEIANKYGMSPIETLESFGFFDSSSLLAHCVHIDKDDIEIIKNYDVSIATCPSSNLILGSGIAPLYSFIKNNINVSIGTDGAGSNNNLNMFKEMYLADNLQAGVLNQFRAITTIDALKMATVRGAIALGYDDLGRIEEGYLADLIMIDVSKPNMRPINNICNNLVNACETSNIIMTMVDGKVLYKDGKYYCGVDYEEVVDACEDISSRIEESNI